MIEDDIMREIRATRDNFAAEHNYDVRAMVAALRAEEAASGRLVVSFPPRPVMSGTESTALLVPALPDAASPESVQSPSAA